MLEKQIDEIIKTCGFYALPEERREKIRLLVAGYGLMCLLDSKVAKEAEARVKAALDPANIARAAKMLREQRAKDVAPEPDSSVSKDSKRRYRSIDDE